jgi:hypothetical protein
VSGILFPSATLPVASSKKIVDSIKNHPIKTPVCIMFLMHTAIVSKRNATPNMVWKTESLSYERRRWPEKRPV